MSLADLQTPPLGAAPADLTAIETLVRKSGSLPAASTRNATSSTKRFSSLRDEKTPTQ